MKNSDICQQIYKQYAGRMCAVCMRYCGDRALAEDLMQDGFMQVFKSLDKFSDRGEGSLRAWIERIMINTCLQYLRKKDLLRHHLDLNLSADPLDEEPQPERVPTAELLQMIARLPQGYRTVLNLYYFENKSHKEIAKLLNINENSSTSQLYRAKNILAKMILDYERNNR